MSHAGRLDRPRWADWRAARRARFILATRRNSDGVVLYAGAQAVGGRFVDRIMPRPRDGHRNAMEQRT